MRVIIIGGFLGSGKTTTLLNLGKHLTDNGQKVAIIVNEIGEIGIDGDTITNSGMITKEITNGCICCTLKINMEYTLENLYNEFGPDTVIIEPTGLAFPNQIKHDLENMNIGNLSFAPIVTLVDGSRFKAEVNQIPKFVLSQIEEADILGINKNDIADTENLNNTRNFLKDKNPEAKIIDFSAKYKDEKFRDFIDHLDGSGRESGASEYKNSISMSEVSMYSGEFAIFSKNLTFELSEQILRNIAQDIRYRVLSRSPEFIGHIKTSMGFADTRIKTSITSSKEDPHVEKSVIEDDTAVLPKLKFLAAITGIPENELTEIVKSTISENLKNESIKFEEKSTHCHSQNYIDLMDSSIN
ncbi:MAG: CobW family GTP-binding protein [Methanohalobium sp.]|uniref:CobW family GTP-binding protein n=1 Tax=Methanohalobium sp. TaxID=2837493 RepID=UPI0039792A0E